MFGRKKKTMPPRFPKLIGVVNGTQHSGYADLVIEVDFGKGVETLPFTYTPGDDAPVAQLVARWFADRPNVRLDGPPQKA